MAVAAIVLAWQTNQYFVAVAIADLQQEIEWYCQTSHQWHCFEPKVEVVLTAELVMNQAQQKCHQFIAVEQVPAAEVVTIAVAWQEVAVVIANADFVKEQQQGYKSNRQLVSAVFQS